LEVHVGHRAFQAADLSCGQWRQLSAMADVLDDDPAAAALLLATVHRCDILTGDPRPLRGAWRRPADHHPWAEALAGAAVSPCCACGGRRGETTTSTTSPGNVDA
jgi:hypothetical protein